MFRQQLFDRRRLACTFGGLIAEDHFDLQLSMSFGACTAANGTVFYLAVPAQLAAFTWGDKGTAADIIPADLVVAYEGQKGHLTDIEPQKVMDIILENVAPTNA